MPPSDPAAEYVVVSRHRPSSRPSAPSPRLVDGYEIIDERDASAGPVVIRTRRREDDEDLRTVRVEEELRPRRHEEEELRARGGDGDNGGVVIVRRRERVELGEEEADELNEGYWEKRRGRTAEKGWKRLVVACDGTWLNSDNGMANGELAVPSNVTRISRAIRPVSRDGVSQIVYYHFGVGARGNIVNRVIGGTTGGGLEENIREGYSFLSNNYTPGDEIILIGFSRGAYTARSIAGLIGQIGMLNKKGLGAFPAIFEDVMHRRERHYRDKNPTIPFAHKPSASDPRYREELARRGLTYLNVRIKAIGVWDTVGSLGAPRIGWLTRVGLQPLQSHEMQFNDTRLDNCVENAFQALALDERRTAFSPAVWEKPRGNTTTLRQVWFPGVHSNIGGGYDDQELANITLAWMSAQLSPFLDLRTKYILDQATQNDAFYRRKHQPLRPWSFGRICNSLSGIYALGGSTARTPGLYTAVDPDTGRPTKRPLRDTNEYVHPSVRTRVRLGGPGTDDRGRYDPEALDAWRLVVEDDGQGGTSVFWRRRERGAREVLPESPLWGLEREMAERDPETFAYVVAPPKTRPLRQKRVARGAERDKGMAQDREREGERQRLPPPRSRSEYDGFAAPAPAPVLLDRPHNRNRSRIQDLDLDGPRRPPSHSPDDANDIRGYASVGEREGGYRRPRLSPDGDDRGGGYRDAPPPPRPRSDYGGREIRRGGGRGGGGGGGGGGRRSEFIEREDFIEDRGPPPRRRAEWNDFEDDDISPPRSRREEFIPEPERPRSRPPPSTSRRAEYEYDYEDDRSPPRRPGGGGGRRSEPVFEREESRSPPRRRGGRSETFIERSESRSPPPRRRGGRSDPVLERERERERKTFVEERGVSRSPPRRRGGGRSEPFIERQESRSPPPPSRPRPRGGRRYASSPESDSASASPPRRTRPRSVSRSRDEAYGRGGAPYTCGGGGGGGGGELPYPRDGEWGDLEPPPAPPGGWR